MTNPLRIAHIPARTAYVWKLQSTDFTIVNGQNIHATTVPTALTAKWILNHQPLDWVDVIHLHHIEFELLDDLEHLIDVCRTSGTGIVLTVHDLHAMFTTDQALAERYALLSQDGVFWTTTSDGAARDLQSQYSPSEEVCSLPLGYAIPPALVAGRSRTHSTAPRYFMYGAMRPNRDHLSTLANWSLGLTHTHATFNVLLRALSAIDFARQEYRPSDLIALLQSDQRINTVMKPYPSDENLVEMALESDCLVLPYRWGSHSGQLEFAFDLGLLPLVPPVGYLTEQHARHGNLVPDPVWIDWDGGNPYLQGEQFLEALLRAQDVLLDRNFLPNPQFLEYREVEHQGLLHNHVDLYERAVEQART
ncbi:hypothetical protein [Haloglycomyces albus]|uniref:hypothetical protein n=1 Tax=Haloglycomyces albus TaxID=526067 RepID=UPI00046D8611|nr:hypothetical protein [Haloglycomyces albus]